MTLNTVHLLLTNNRLSITIDRSSPFFLNTTEHCSYFNIMIKRISLLLILTASVTAKAQTLDAYVREALDRNAQLQEKQFHLEKGLAALAEAKGLFWPDVSFSTTYTRAEGGRTIDLPLGDLLNPVYSTLNQLTQSQQFPQLENRRELLNPNDFYDAKIRAVWPLLNAEIVANREVKRYALEMQEIETAMYRRELSAQVKTAWFQYRQAAEAVTIYEKALTLVQESERVNARLVQQGKAAPLALRRAQNEVVAMRSNIQQAQEQQKRAGFYFNFLLNRPLESAIITEDASLDILSIPAAGSFEQREELRQLDKALSMADAAKTLEKRFHQPKLNAFVDAGSQGFEWELNRSTWYYLGGVQITIPIVQGGRHKNRLRQVEAERKALLSKKQHVAGLLDVQFRSAVESFTTALSVYESARVQRAFAENYYADMARMYREGTLLYIELLDAQQQLTRSQLQESIALSNAGIRRTEVQRVTSVSNQ
jgi:outer membrane protein TolC